MYRNSAKFFALTLALVAASLLLQPAAANACMGCQGWPFCIPTIPSADNGEIYVTFPSPHQAQLAVYGYETSSLVPGGECVTGLAPIAGIDSVKAVVNYNSVTNEPFSEVIFTANDLPAHAVTRLAADLGLVFPEGATWSTFVSSITGTVPDGVPNHFVIEVGLARDVTPAQFVEALQDSGAFITGSSHAGLPHGGDHLYTKRFEDFEIIAVLPPSFSDTDLGEAVKE